MADAARVVHPTLTREVAEPTAPAPRLPEPGTSAGGTAYGPGMLPRPSLPRLLTALLVPLALTSPLLVAAPAQADHAGDVPGPVNAGGTFGWWSGGGLAYDETFVGALPGERWKVRGRGEVQNQNGMLTLNTTSRGTLTATRVAAGSRVGRWEIRLRSRRYESDGTDYRVTTSLVPRRRAQGHCGGQDVMLEDYRTDDTAPEAGVRLGVRTLPDLSHTATEPVLAGDTAAPRSEGWHTYAVEVRRKRISWFVDAHVVRTETRPEALSGVAMTVRFAMVGVKGEDMNRSRMQMDWLRHWDTSARNRLPTDAPALDAGTDDSAC